MIHPEFSGIHQVVGDLGIVLFISAQIGQQAVMQLPIRPQRVALLFCGLARWGLLEMLVGVKSSIGIDVVVVAVDKHLVSLLRAIQPAMNMVVVRVGMVQGNVLDVAHRVGIDRKSTRLNSSHPSISYAVFCLKKKKKFFLDQLLRNESIIGNVIC